MVGGVIIFPKGSVKTMKLVFVKDVPNIAKAGEVKEVADGYGRNFLIPRGLAVIATPFELGKLEARRQVDAQRQAWSQQEASALADRLQELTLNFKVKVGPRGRLYGSVTNSDIATEILRLTGHEIDKRKIELVEPIRKLGSHEALVRLSKELTPRVRVVIEEGEA